VEARARTPICRLRQRRLDRLGAALDRLAADDGLVVQAVGLGRPIIGGDSQTRGTDRGDRTWRDGDRERLVILVLQGNLHAHEVVESLGRGNLA
jgi:hypothetical protein